MNKLIFLKKDWVQNSKLKKLRFINKDNFYNLKSQNDSLDFELTTSSKVKNGWYLFGIKHKYHNYGTNGFLRIGKFGYPQGRPMNAGRIRWRVIHVIRENNVSLILDNFENIKLINILCLIKIPFFDAVRRVKKRYRNFDNLYKIKNSNFKFIWKNYNGFLNSQVKPINRYKEWLNKVESSLIYKFKKYKTGNYPKSFFTESNFEDIQKVSDSRFVIAFSNKGYLNKYSKSIIYSLIKENSKVKILYGDEDYIDEDNVRRFPDFKTAWNRELFLVNPFYSSCWVVESNLWNRGISIIEQLKIKININNLILVIALEREKNKETNSIFHLPYITFHKFLKGNKNYLKSKVITKDYFKILSNYDVLLGKCLNIKQIKENIQIEYDWQVNKRHKLSIIICTKDNLKDLKKCINSINATTKEYEIEIIIVNNGSKDRITIEYLKSLEDSSTEKNKFLIIDIPGKFNYSKLNNSASKLATGEVILFLNNDVEIITNNWVRLILSNCTRPDIGFVGAKLFFQNMTIQHAGVILGIGGVAGHSHKYFDSNSNGFSKRLKFNQEISALTGAFLAIEKSKWIKIGGFDEKNLKVNYNDVDVCLKARKIGLKNLFISEIHAFHKESSTRGIPKGRDFIKWKKEYAFMKRKWGINLLSDPFYSPHLSLEDERFNIGFRTDKISLRTNTID